jgi:hypothetical protein
MLKMAANKFGAGNPQKGFCQYYSERAYDHPAE